MISNGLTKDDATLKEVVTDKIKNLPTPLKGTFAYGQMINLVYIASKMKFGSVEEHFPEGASEKSLASVYPTALLANHVSEADILALSIVYRRLSPQIKMTIPTREDLLRNDFLRKEFRAKGLLKLIFSLIDKSGIIPAYMSFIGCVPIKRPFRDNSRDLLKKGELRDAVDADWSSLVETIEKGKNLFMFPEGTFNHDGFLNQIKKGVFYLKSKVTEIQFNSFNLTYDSLSFKKTKLHISYGSPFAIGKEETSDQVTKIVQDKLGEGYTITLGNLFSYLLFKLEENSLLSIESLNQRIIIMRDKILTEYSALRIGSELRKYSGIKDLDQILKRLKQMKFIDLVGGKVKILSALTSIPKSMHHLEKHNIVLYHKNQLTKHLEKLDKIFESSIKNAAY